LASWLVGWLGEGRPADRLTEGRLADRRTTGWSGWSGWLTEGRLVGLGIFGVVVPVVAKKIFRAEGSVVARAFLAPSPPSS